MTYDRRNFLKAISVVPFTAAILPSKVKANAPPKVVIIGGGFAGSTVAKYLRLWSGNSIDVNLIDPRKFHTSCVLSNLVLNEQLNLNQLKLSHNGLSDVGVNVIQDKVISIDHANKKVKLKNGVSLSYDKLVIATGIGFKKLKNTNFKLTPHAWIAGSQTNLLAKQLTTLQAGSTFVMTIPQKPYRCPPGPYERACVVADMIKSKGYNGGDTKVIVLDENNGIQAEKATFEKAYNGIYRNIIEYIPNAIIESVNSDHLMIETSVGNFQGDVVNIIPRHRAVGFVRKSGLTDGGDWAAVDPLTYQSTNTEFEDVYIVGDSQGSSQPKSAHMANAQAKVCCDAIIRSFNGESVFTNERIQNITTNSACYSPITSKEASWLTANYAYDISTQQMKLTHIGEAEGWSRENYDDMFDWANNLFADSFNRSL